MSHWASYSHIEGCRDADSPTASISIVMDAGAHIAFSGVRVVIVHKEGDHFQDVIIEQKHPDQLGNRFSSTFSSRVDSFTRKTLRPPNVGSHYDTKLKSFCDANIQPGRTEPETFTCIFELECWHERMGYTLMPLKDWKSSPDKDSHPQLQISFDRTWPLVDDKRSVTLYLQSTKHIFFDEYEARTDDNPLYAPNDHHRGYPIHEIRVMPISRTARAFDTLPSHIIRTIVSYTIGDPSGLRGELSSWRSHLLSCALVQRSWLHVIELFWIKIGRKKAKIGNLITVARSLEHCPQYGSFFVNFDEDWLGYPFEGYQHHLATAQSLFDAMRTILRLGSSSISSLSLRKITCSHSIDLLSEMRVVKDFRLYPQLPPWISNFKGQQPTAFCDMPSPKCLGLLQILKICRGWRQLKSLLLVGWDQGDVNSKASFEDSLGIGPEDYDQLHCKNFSKGLLGPVEHIRLSNGVVKGCQLLGFFSPALRDLHLVWIVGITNPDLLDFLRAIAPSVELIVVEGCDIYRLPNEEHAIEAALPQLKKLRRLSVQGEALTGNIIARMQVPLKEGESYLGVSGSREVPFPVPLDELPLALETTSWGRILICGSSEDIYSKFQARMVAKRRGIKLGIMLEFY